MDYYRITTAERGRLRLALTAMDGQVFARGRLLDDASGDLLIQSDQRGPGEATAYMDQHVQAGTYFVEVSPSRNSTGAADDHGYRFRTRFDASVPPFTRLPVDTFPFSVAVADVNGDGRPDLVTANSGTSDVSVLLGDGKSGFAAPQSHFRHRCEAMPPASWTSTAITSPTPSASRSPAASSRTTRAASSSARAPATRSTPTPPFVVVNPATSPRDFTIVQTAGLPEIAALDRND